MAELINLIAPEHLELQLKNAANFLLNIRHAGAIFMGNYSVESVGDYFAGPNHVLPTGGSARFFSPLGVYDFIKRTSLIYYNKRALKKNAAHISKLAVSEKLIHHARAVELRL
jgi:histidinol dehydrogenase